MEPKEPQTLSFFRRSLPHWLVTDSAYFVTLRIKGTIPRSVVLKMKEEREEFECNSADPIQRSRLRKNQFRKIEAILDAQHDGYLPLNDQSVAEMVQRSHTWLKEQGWHIYASVLMGNHAHCLMRSENGRSAALVNDLDRFKRYTSTQANRILDRTGRFWAKDQFDYWVRNPNQFEKFVRYIVMNPVKADLVSHWRDWPWTEIGDDVKYCMEGL